MPEFFFENMKIQGKISLNNGIFFMLLHFLMLARSEKKSRRKYVYKEKGWAIERSDWDEFFRKFCHVESEIFDEIFQSFIQDVPSFVIVPQALFAAFSTILLFFFGVLTFFLKKENRQILLRLNCASGEFFAAHCYIFSLSRENTAKKAKRQQQFVVFSSAFFW